MYPFKYARPADRTALPAMAGKLSALCRWRAAVLVCLVIGAPYAHADVTRTDIQVAARALGFVSNPLAGRVKLGIVYSVRSQRSRRQAESLQAMLLDGFRTGSLEFLPTLVEAGDAADARVDLFFLTEHLAPEDTPALTAGTAPLPCITTDIDQVRNGACAIGVRSRPKVEVFVSRAAATASDITFSTVFRVMITEL